MGEREEAENRRRSLGMIDAQKQVRYWQRGPTVASLAAKVEELEQDPALPVRVVGEHLPFEREQVEGDEHRRPPSLRARALEMAPDRCAAMHSPLRTRPGREP